MHKDQTSKETGKEYSYIENKLCKRGFEALKSLTKELYNQDRIENAFSTKDSSNNSYIEINQNEEIERIDLHESDLEKIPEQLISLKSLEEIALSGNKIKEINENKLERLESLKKLYLQGNPLNNNTIEKIREYQEKNGIEIYHEQLFHIQETNQN